MVRRFTVLGKPNKKIAAISIREAITKVTLRMGVSIPDEDSREDDDTAKSYRPLTHSQSTLVNDLVK